MTDRYEQKTTDLWRYVAHVTCAGTALLLLLACGASHVSAADKALNDLRLYNYKAANPSLSDSSGKSSSFSASTANLLDDAANSDGTTDATTTSTVKKAAPKVPDSLKTRSVDAEEKLQNIQEDYGRQNLAEQDIDNVTVKNRLAAGETPGVRVGTFVLRPTVSQSINHEATKSGTTTKNRGFLESGFKAELLSDWDVHQLKVNSSGTWQTNISGSGATKPTFDINALLRLDITRDTTAKFNAGYNFSRGDASDPNSVSGADIQAELEALTAGASVEQRFGLIRGTVGLDLSRNIYGDVTLANGTTQSQTFRNQTTAKLRGRIGYEISPVMIPFIEASTSRSFYDQLIDPTGYKRSNMIYALRAGIQYNPDEKLNGEISAGLQTATFDDARLKSIDAFSVDGNATWSIQRGTDATFGLTTTIDPSTQSDVSGSLTYAANAALTHMLSDNLTARLKGSIAFRNYTANSTVGDQTISSLGAGLTWGINRYLDLTGDVSLETTKSKTASDLEVLRAGVGLALKR